MSNNFLYQLQFLVSKSILFFFRLADVGLMHPAREYQRRALHRTVDYIQKNMSNAACLQTRAEIIHYAIQQINIPGSCLEFGVASGGTLRDIARLSAQTEPQRMIHGFDSFSGLPEAWAGTSFIRGAFSRTRPPKLPAHIILHPGLFNETIPRYCAQYPQTAAFIHIDCDLYSSASAIFTHLAPVINAGTLILFDEYFNHPQWEACEYKAWQEFCEQHQVVYEYLAFAHQQVLIRVSKRN